MLIVVVAPSGVGKTSMIEEYARAHPEQWGGFITSTTTRAPREKETVIRGSHEYEFVDETVYALLAHEGKFLKPFGEYGNRYGTKLEYLENEKVWGNRYAYFAVLLIEGAQAFMRYALESGRQHVIRFVYLDLDSEEERTRRLHARGETNPKRFKPQLEEWRKAAKHSGIPFIYLDAGRHNAKALAEELFDCVFGPGRTEE
jgi:guanylate kinase